MWEKGESSKLYNKAAHFIGDDEGSSNLRSKSDREVWDANNNGEVLEASLNQSFKDL